MEKSCWHAGIRPDLAWRLPMWRPVTDGQEEQHTLAGGVRREEAGYLVVEEGQACSAETQRVRGQIHAARGQAGVELGRAVATVPQPLEDRGQVSHEVHVYRRIARELLGQREVARLASEATRADQLKGLA